MFDKADIIKRWVKVPYLLNGRNHSGIDCIGLIYEIYAYYGQMFPGWHLRKNHAEDIGTWLRLMRIYFKQVSGEQLGDMLLMRYPDNQSLHCGFCLDDKEFIHIAGSNGVVVDKIKDYKSKIARTMRIRDKFKCQQQ